MSHANLIKRRANVLGLHVSDPQKIEDIMRLGIPSFSNASVEEIDRELKLAVACEESGLEAECDEFYRIYFGEPIGCQPPPDRCPPIWGDED
jgi:hypothetical protein